VATRRRSGSRGRQLDFLSNPKFNLRGNVIQAGYFIRVKIPGSRDAGDGVALARPNLG
jgi:hypothetical protein